MKNIKFVIGFSVFGFLLSFVAGFASNSTFLKMLLNALIFAFVFAGIGALVSFLWKNFLASDFEQAEYSSGKQNNESKKTGQTVDITIQDESLQTDDNASQFFIGSNHQMLTNDDLGVKNQSTNDSNNNQANSVVTESSENKVEMAKKSEKSEKSEKSDSPVLDDKGFVPVALTETASNISSTEAKPGAEYLNQKNSNNDENSSVELDVLPDLQELQNIQEMTASKDVPEPSPVVNSSFIPEDVRRTVSEANTESKDAALMAKAISTLLSKE